MTPDDETRPNDLAWETESDASFLERVEQLVTREDDTLQVMRHVRELAIRYEARAQFLIELKERCEQALHPDAGVTVPDPEELMELLAEHEAEIRAEWDATEPIPDGTI